MRTTTLWLLSLSLCFVGCAKNSGTPAPEATPPATTAATAPATAPSAAKPAAEAVSRVTDTWVTSKGPVALTPIHHASTLLTFGGKAIYIDPAGEGDYTGLPKADFVFVSDIHPDHLDPVTIGKIQKSDTVFVGPQAVADKAPELKLTVLKNGDSKSFGDFSVDALPMYNLTRGPSAGKLFHDKGRGDGFVFTFGDKRVYFSGDTECIPEMKALKNIDVAFVCMNLPYTMPPSEAAECVKAFHPKVLIPYHYKGSSLDELTAALKGTPVEIRQRAWY